MTHEEWREVGGFLGYEVSNLGRVRSFKLSAIPRILKPSRDKDGYPLVVFIRNGDRFTRRVPTLVLEAFVGPRPEGMQVCHGIGGRQDNSISNLSWGSKSKNHGEDRRRDGTDNRGSRNGRAKLNSNVVVRIREFSTDILSKKLLAKELNISVCTINDIQKGRTWTHV